MKVLSIDASSHTGWAIIDDGKLISYGKIDIPCQNHDWPLGIHGWAKDISEKIFHLIDTTECDKIIIERANSSKFRDSQNVLDWLHFSLIDKLIDEGYYSKLLYRDSTLWRKLVGIKLSKEQKKQNQKISKSNKEGTIFKIDGKRKGRITKKHLAILKVKELFNIDFKLNQNDIAEAILLGYSYFIQQ